MIGDGRSGEAREMSEIVELNVGGVFYTTRKETLGREAGSVLAKLIGAEEGQPTRDSKGRLFIDRDGVLFRYVLDYLRTKALALPDAFRERERLKQEAIYYNLPGLAEAAHSAARQSGYITVGYRGSFAFGRDGLADVKFRKITRILVCGRVTLCRDVFGETLNESRDPDHGLPDRYDLVALFTLIDPIC
jgi:hypothetical protein